MEWRIQYMLAREMDRKILVTGVREVVIELDAEAEEKILRKARQMWSSKLSSPRSSAVLYHKVDHSLDAINYFALT
jgi:hypothetical protein